MATQLLSSGFGSVSGVLSPSLWFFPGTEQQEPPAKALEKVCLETVLVKTQECSCGEGASVFQRKLCELWLGRKSRKDKPRAWRRWEGVSPCGQPAVMHLMVMLGEQCCSQSCVGVGSGHSPGRGSGSLESKELLNQEKNHRSGKQGERLPRRIYRIQLVLSRQSENRETEVSSLRGEDMVSTLTGMEKSERIKKKSDFEAIEWLRESWVQTLSDHQKVSVELRMEGVLSHLPGSQVKQRF